MSECEAHPDATYHLNVTKMFELIHILDGLGAHIIYLSTNQVFSGVEPYASATTSYNPPNEYGRQKVAIETLIKTHCKKWTVIRLTKVVSFRLPLFQNWLARLQQQLSIEAFYDMTMAPIALNQVVNVLIKLGEKKIVGCYQLSGTMDISYYDFAKQLSCQINQPAHFVKPVSAIKNGIHKNFLPPYTTLDCLNTIALCGVMSLQPADVLNICLENGV
jgi:dTDP-4-dehydrorhamnose reductase